LTKKLVRVRFWIRKLEDEVVGIKTWRYDGTQALDHVPKSAAAELMEIDDEDRVSLKILENVLARPRLSIQNWQDVARLRFNPLRQEIPLESRQPVEGMVILGSCDDRNFSVAAELGRPLAGGRVVRERCASHENRTL
jgi:hypothetical protein